ncbi:MAG: hypothetical protein IJE79_03910 [Alphaproteobacteria bacterium]|nr:hypothetical protein [Alphaproteobacteria bacterium]
MAKFDKKWWFVHVPATVVVAGLIAFGVTKCNRLENLKQQTTDSVENMANATEKLNQAAAKIDSLFVVDKAKSDTIRQLKVVVEKQHDSIVGLNKSLSATTKKLKVVKAQLEDCENNKKAQQQQAKKSSKPKAKKPAVAKKPEAKKPEAKPVQQVVVQAVDTCSNGNATVRVSASENSGNIVVTGRNNATVILENSSANSGNIIVGDNNVVQINGNNSVRVNDTVRAVDTVPAAEVREPVTCTFRIVTVYGNTR